MPNRILKESICASPTLDKLSTKAENLFYRLLVNCDDFGKTDGRLIMILTNCYPLRVKKMQESELAELIIELVENELLKIYNSGDRIVIQINTWEKHQQIRAKKSKHPDYDNSCKYLMADDIRKQADDFHINTNDGNCVSNPIQSNPIQKNPININNDTTLNDNGKRDNKELAETKVSAIIPEKDNKDSKKYPPEFIPLRKQVFDDLKKRLGYKIPNLGKEVSAINWMLKNDYTPENMLFVYDELKKEEFWKEKPISMQTVKKYIGEKLKHQKHNSNKFQQGKYGGTVRR